MNTSNFDHIPDAIYHHHDLEEHRENPLIACLPPIYTDQVRIEALRLKPKFDIAERHLDGRIRVFAIIRLLNQFFQPLSHHLALEEKISILIRTGYLGRSPVNGDYRAHLQNGYERVMSGDLQSFAFPEVRSTAMGMSLFGCSGSGKSRTIERVLSLYPQALKHPKHRIQQVVYLKLDCPNDGDLITLCLSFFRAIDQVLGTNYSLSHGRKKLGEGKLLMGMCQIANLHALGVLIIDEIQNLSEARSGGAEKMHNFFVSLANTIGVPVIQIGTHKARKFFEKTFRAARRVAGIGSLQWDRLPRDDQWQNLLQAIWKYQWLHYPQRLDDELEATMYDLTQGVMDIVVKLFVLSQVRAITTKTERLTPELLKRVYQDEMKPVHPMLEALRNRRADQIKKYDDLVMPHIEARALAMAAELESVVPEPIAEDAQPPASDKLKRLLSILEQMEIPQDIGLPMVEQVLAQYPNLPIATLINKLTEHARQEKPEPVKAIRVKQAQWANLEHRDIRYLFATAGPNNVYDMLRQKGLICDLQALITQAG